MKPTNPNLNSTHRPLRPKLPLRSRPKQPISHPQPITPSPPSKLSRDFIIKHSMFWKQQLPTLSSIKSLILSDLSLPSFQSNTQFNILQLSNIQLLSLSKNNIISLHPLAELDSLIELNLNNNQIFDISPLSFLQKLESVYLNNNKINNIEPLYELGNLKNLHVYNNQIPYREKPIIIEFVARLIQLDIQKNDVYKQSQKTEWLSGKLRKFNGEPVSVKMKNEIQMGSTAQSFRPFSSTVMSRPSTARPGTAQQKAETEYMGLQEKVEELEHVYLRLDNDYEEQIVMNVRLKDQLRSKEERKRREEQRGDDREEMKVKVERLRGEVEGLKKVLINKDTSPQLKQLFEMTVKYQKYKLSLLNKQKQQQQSTIPIKQKIQKKPQIPTYEEKPFHADQEIVFDSDSDEREKVKKKEFDNSDDQLEEMLRRNQEELNQLKEELNSMKR